MLSPPPGLAGANLMGRIAGGPLMQRSSRVSRQRLLASNMPATWSRLHSDQR